MDSKVRTLIITIIGAGILWLIGGFVLNKALGMVCVIVGITLIGLAAGNVMNSPVPDHKKAP